MAIVTKLNALFFVAIAHFFVFIGMFLEIFGIVDILFYLTKSLGAIIPLRVKQVGR